MTHWSLPVVSSWWHTTKSLAVPMHLPLLPWLCSADNLGTSSPCYQRTSDHCWCPNGLPLWLEMRLMKASEAEVFSIMEFHNADTTFCQVSKLFSSGASILPKQRHCTSNFRWEEQLVIKNNNPEVFEFYFPWLPHAQNLNSTDGSCVFVFNILMHFSSRAGWSLQPGFVGGVKDLPDPGLFIPPCL